MNEVARAPRPRRLLAALRVAMALARVLLTVAQIVGAVAQWVR